MKTVCAWCMQVLHEDTSQPPGTSWSICDPCASKEIALVEQLARKGVRYTPASPRDRGEYLERTSPAALIQARLERRQRSARERAQRRQREGGPPDAPG